MVRRFYVGNGEWGSVVFDQLKTLAVGGKMNVLVVQPETVDESYFKTCIGRMRWRQVPLASRSRGLSQEKEADRLPHVSRLGLVVSLVTSLRCERQNRDVARQGSKARHKKPGHVEQPGRRASTTCCWFRLTFASLGSGSRSKGWLI